MFHSVMHTKWKTKNFFNKLGDIETCQKIKKKIARRTNIPKTYAIHIFIYIDIFIIITLYQRKISFIVPTYYTYTVCIYNVY